MTRALFLGAHAPRPIEGQWQFAAAPAGVAASPGDLDHLRLEWMPCDGARPAAAALRASGRWDLAHPRDFDAEDWWYRCRFSADAQSSTRLRFEGLATIADVWLNGHHILSSRNMFVEHVVDIQPWLRLDNELVMCFRALSTAVVPTRPRAKWRTRLTSQPLLRWHRTTLLGRIAGWCPPVAPVGPWRPILIETSPTRIDRSRMETHLDGDEGVIQVEIYCSSRSLEPPRGTMAVNQWSAPLACKAISGDRWTLSGTVRVPHPDLWWPHTHGQQPLYDVSAIITTAAIEESVDLGRVGFRTLTVDRGPDGTGFGLVVNGSPLFCRGACWTPLDLASLSAAPSAYREALEQLRDAGMNMLRVSGTMVYEARAFYDLCDELGILVWQDFMFANMDYPWDDEGFAAQATLEAAQVLDALQARPSLAVVCGNSEVAQQAAMLGLPATIKPNAQFEAHLGDLVRTIATGATWVAGSPSGGAFPFQADCGITHYYGVGAYRRPFDDARRAGVRFASECLAFSNVPDGSTIDLATPGGESPGHHPLWKAGVPRDPGSGWDFEDVRDHYVRALFGVDPSELRAQNPGRYLALGRVATGEAMLRTLAEWRRPGSSCRGALVWFARDLQPGAGWGLVDSTGRAKAAYWFVKRAMAPLALLPADEGLNGLWLHVVNDTAESIAAELHVALYLQGRQVGQQTRTQFVVPARGQHSTHANTLFDGFLDLTYAYRFGPPSHDVVTSTLYDRTTGAVCATASYFPASLNLPIDYGLDIKARTELTRRGYVLVLETNRFAQAVAIDLDGWLPEDNYLDLQPGVTRRVWLRRTSEEEIVPRGTVCALNGPGMVAVVVGEAIDAGR